MFQFSGKNFKLRQKFKRKLAKRLPLKLSSVLLKQVASKFFIKRGGYSKKNFPLFSSPRLPIFVSNLRRSARKVLVSRWFNRYYSKLDILYCKILPKTSGSFYNLAAFFSGYKILRKAFKRYKKTNNSRINAGTARFTRRLYNKPAHKKAVSLD